VIPAVDFARELGASMTDVKSLTVELLARMELHKRDRRDMWHSSETGKPPLEWLEQLFEDVNNGRHEEFTLSTLEHRSFDPLATSLRSRQPRGKRASARKLSATPLNGNSFLAND